MPEQPHSPTPPTYPTPPIPAPGQPPAPGPTVPTDYTDGFGIASIILAAMSLSIPGLVVGLIGAHKAKKLGASPILSRIGWIVNLVMTIFGLIIAGVVIWAIITHPKEFKSSFESSTDSHESKSTKSLTGNGYTLDVPTSFVDDIGDYPAADLDAGDDRTGLYLAAYSEDATDIASSTTVANYADKAFEAFQGDTNFTGQTRTQVPAGTIPNPKNLDVLDYRMEGNYGIHKYIYYDRYIKTSTGYYQLTTWTAPGDLDNNFSSIKSILASFHEITT
jgi:phage shock protein PspC (stress-responsive transcriptional regulator)